jgi:hypothetical protein
MRTLLLASLMTVGTAQAFHLDPELVSSMVEDRWPMHHAAVEPEDAVPQDVLVPTKVVTVKVRLAPAEAAMLAAASPDTTLARW